MKKSRILLMALVMIGLASCSTLSGTTNTAAVTSGAACGKALVALNSSHKAGTLSLTNATDLSNMLVVVGAYNSLKSNKDDSGYKKSFATGMVTGGNGLITTANATTIMNNLLNSSGLSGVNSSNIASNAATIGSIITLLGALK